MQNETLKTAFTYLLALVVIVGSGVLMVVPSQVPPNELLPFLTFACGAVIAYVFSREQTQLVQSGNGIERARLDVLDNKIHDAAIASALATPAPPTALVADMVEVAGENVEVRQT